MHAEDSDECAQSVVANAHVVTPKNTYCMHVENKHKPTQAYCFVQCAQHFNPPLIFTPKQLMCARRGQR